VHSPPITGKPSPDHPPEIRSLKEIHVGVPQVVSERIARIPVHLEAQDGLRAGFELQWRYPESTLRVGDGKPGFENLFTLAAVLPILNYLPFCRSLRVEGPLDAGDAEWVGRVAEATAREIQRQKLTPENPYLRTEVLGHLSKGALASPAIRSNTPRVPPSRIEVDGGRAAVLLDGSAEGLLSWAILKEIGAEPLGIVFDNPATRLGAATNLYGPFQARHPGQVAVIWTNLSHLYDFFLRHLDFLRVNYQSVHADTTPLRLFEAEVGVLAALPLLWARGRGHMVTPRRTESLERRSAAVGGQVPPAFDQTRAFDDFSTRFFGRKGWGVQQWTLLRPASELVVQRALGKRYPDLFSLQVGCLRPRVETRRSVFVNGAGDAPVTPFPRREPDSEKAGEPRGREAGKPDTNPAMAEWETDGGSGPEGLPREFAPVRDTGSPDREIAGGNESRRGEDVSVSGSARSPWVRALPCGACEACRRLVVILTALGHDPKTLGYGPVKIERALAHTRRVGHLPPEARIQRHVLHLLEQAQAGSKAMGGSAPDRALSGTATEGKPSPSRFEAHPEVESLRFDDTRTFIDTIPLPFRKPVYAILLQYARGALRREEREWKEFDLMSSAEISLPKHPRDLEFLVT